MHITNDTNTILMQIHAEMYVRSHTITCNTKQKLNVLTLPFTGVLVSMLVPDTYYTHSKERKIQFFKDASAQ